MAAHTLLDWKPAFLDALRKLPVVGHACTVAGVHRSTVYRARHTDPNFAEEWHYAMESGIDLVESEAFRRGVDGYDEPVIYRGKVMHLVAYSDDEDGVRRQRPVLDANGQPVPLTIRRYSDQLLALLLRGRRKEIYSERVEHTGAGGGPIALDPTQRAQRVLSLVLLAQQRRDEGCDLC